MCGKYELFDSPELEGDLVGQRLVVEGEPLRRVPLLPLRLIAELGPVLVPAADLRRVGPGERSRSWPDD